MSNIPGVGFFSPDASVKSRSSKVNMKEKGWPDPHKRLRFGEPLTILNL